MLTVVVCTLYKFVTLPDCAALADRLRPLCAAQGILGTLLLAEEGINGTIAGSRAGIDAVMAFLRCDPRLADLAGKESLAPVSPFHRLKVKVKSEIVAFGRPEADPRRQNGVYVSPQAWNELIQDPEVLLVDTRNEYEYRVGTFRGAVNPRTSSFTDFPVFAAEKLDPQRHKKIAMFCTGGIRCEKATAYLLAQGYEEVYHLQGGILKYLEEVDAQDSLWEGECFVFDQRVSVDHDLRPGSYSMCYACQQPLAAEERCHPAFEEGISCPYCVDSLTPERRDALAERQRQVTLARQRGQPHIGRTPPVESKLTANS